MLSTTNPLNDFSVLAVESCGLNFSENTPGLKTQGQRLLSPRGIVFSFPSCVSVRVAIGAETQARGKLFMCPKHWCAGSFAWFEV